MAVSRQKKEEIVRDLEDKFARHKAAVFVDYSGISVPAVEGLRGELRKEGIDMKIAKKTLIALVLGKLNVNVDIKSLPGQVAVVLGYGDEVAPAKIVNKFVKQLENLKIVGGIFEKAFIPAENVTALANIPSREELLARAVGSIAFPMSGFLNVMQGNIRGLVQVLNAISKK